MIIEIHGGQFNNKGALKMLTTCINNIKREFPNATFVVDACVGKPQQLESLGLKTFAFKRGWMGSRRFPIGLLAQRILAGLDKLFPSFMKDKMTLAKVDAIIDVAGFAYTDQWGYKPSQDFAKLVRWYKAHNKKVIMLPQAFGTFNHPQIKPAIQSIADHVDLLFARDNTSYKHVAAFNNDAKRINQSPDMTMFVNAIKSTVSNAEDLGRDVGIIPNMRMLDQGGDYWKEHYVDALNQIADLALKMDLNPIFVIHDQSGEDMQVAQMALAKRQDKLQAITIDDPWELKKKLSTMRFVAGSRFHGLVAALSTGVPVLAIGWSHKYAELLADFHLNDCLMTEQNIQSTLAEKIQLLSGVSTNLSTRLIVSKQLQQQETLNEQMWNSVCSLLGGYSA